MIKMCLMYLVLSFGMALGGTGYCQDGSVSQDTRRVSGQVSATDWVGDKLVVRTFDFGDSDEIIFVVPDNTPVTKGLNDSSLANINIGDRVTVEYSDTVSGLKASRITVKQ